MIGPLELVQNSLELRQHPLGSAPLDDGCDASLERFRPESEEVMGGVIWIGSHMGPYVRVLKGWMPKS